jgi:hypothetical protein
MTGLMSEFLYFDSLQELFKESKTLVVILKLVSS